MGIQEERPRLEIHATLLRKIVASKGGNYLLNVGPTAQGELPDPSLERMAAIGQWLKVNGESIYGTSVAPFKQAPAWGRVTRKGGKLYLHVFNWPSDGKLTLPLLNTVSKAYLLASPGQSLSYVSDQGGLQIQLPAAVPDPIDSVIVTEIQGDDLRVASPPPLPQAADGTIQLPAADAEIVGSTAKLEGGEAPNIGYWLDTKDYLQWQVQVDKPGEYEVALNYACLESSAGSEYSVSVGDRTLAGKVPATGGWGDYRVVKLGTVRVGAAGVQTVAVRATKKVGMAVMNLCP